ncbi:MAG: metallopeptidase [Planctomycetota bacterium]|nr:metallopeptidase [Planctomycetota bacterium]
MAKRCGALMVIAATLFTQVAVLGVASETASGGRIDPVEKKIEGWTVHVDPALLEGEPGDVGPRALQMLGNHLQRIKIVVPEEAVKKLQTIEIWIEKSNPRLSSMQYRPSRGWLERNGHDVRHAKKVHNTRAGPLLYREQMLKHPAVILHELAHGYHEQILGFEHPAVIDAFEAAKSAGTYEKVMLYTGQQVRHYGLSNHKEYFAEGTEAYFYRNDFFPFVRGELIEHDRKLYEVLKEVWLDDRGE